MRRGWKETNRKTGENPQAPAAGWKFRAEDDRIIKREGWAPCGPPAPPRKTDMILEDLEHRAEELRKRIELVRSYL